MKITIPLALLAFLRQVASQANPEHVLLHHPTEHPWEPVYARKYIISDHERDVVASCKTETHDCDYALIVFLREESCIPSDFVISLRGEGSKTYDCPLLVEGYSIFGSDDIEDDTIPIQYHITNVLELPVYLVPREKFLKWEEHSPVTLEFLLEWEPYHSDVYRGYATDFFEFSFNNITEAVHDEGDFTMTARGYLEGYPPRQFSATILEVGDLYEPVIWEIDIELMSSLESEDDSDDGLEEGGLAGAIIGAAVFGALAGALIMAMFTRKSTQSRSTTQAGHPPHKDVEPTESPQEPTESHNE
uniref:Uncharacterized protein n=1 Tax=Amphora coffeiformis TaxID=265554 RepID=A0A7S3P4V7_9STRA|mmetsp:Transcript_2794/g.5829  ORF Transcript_2794/g.5829 Transcript_2794/m.5829 type:complete len:303 (-) Transcript_2794:114-1022(-)